jgi:hypothetical protein
VPLSADAPTWITAIGTVAAVAAAVLIAVGGWWWSSHARRQRAPRLTLEKDEAWFDSHSGWPTLRLAVVNEEEREAAHDVTVSVEKIVEGGIIHRPLNMSLPWANLVDSQLQPMTIPAGARRYIKVGEFVENSDPSAIDGPTLSVSSRPNVMAGARLQHKPCTFDLTLTATNCDARAWTLTVDFMPQEDGDRKKPQDVTLSVERRR